MYYKQNQEKKKEFFLSYPKKNFQLLNYCDSLTVWVVVERARGEGRGRGEERTQKTFDRGCAAGSLNTHPIHIISRLTKPTYSYNLHVKRYPIHITEVYK